MSEINKMGSSPISIPNSELEISKNQPDIDQNKIAPQKPIDEVVDDIDVSTFKLVEKGQGLLQDAEIVETDKSIAERLKVLDIPAHTDKVSSKIGRFFMNLVHSVLNVFIKTPDFSQDIKSGLEYSPPKIKPLENNDSVKYESEILSRAFGVKGEYRVNILPKNLYPQGTPKLSDIRQNPKLQDCWFLSSIGAVLHSQGPEGITRLISTQNSDGSFNVRLGQNIYNVPGEIEDFGDRSTTVSNSAPWVKILETAMQMYFLDQAEGAELSNHELKQAIKMDFKSARDGLGVLIDGSEIQIFSTADMTAQEVKYEVSQAIREHKPVVLGHMPKGFSLDVLRDGISPGHAVTVLNADRDDGKISVLDPYGRYRLLDVDVFNRSEIYISTPPTD
jgi:hypothetical protein